jgi:hypothetical protein
MKLLELLSSLQKRLPIINGTPFRQALMEEFENYNSLIEDVDGTEFRTLLTTTSQGQFPYHKLSTKRCFLNFIKKVQMTIDKVVEVYYDGYPSNAFNLLNGLLYKNKFAPKKKDAKPSYSKNLKDMYINYFDFDLKFQQKEAQKEAAVFFRLREKPTLWTDKNEYFHLPDKSRESASTARFSIPGFPSLYLGTSLAVCWNELDKPQKDIYACKFLLQKDIGLLNLTIPPQFKEESERREIFNFLITYPLLSVCLMQTRNPSARFKPEYIVPQLLLQSIRKEGLIEGIIYSSTKDNNTDESEKYYNLVFPIQTIDNDGFCKKLKDLFYLSNPISVDKDRLEESEKELTKLKVDKLK